MPAKPGAGGGKQTSLAWRRRQKGKGYALTNRRTGRVVSKKSRAAKKGFREAYAAQTAADFAASAKYARAKGQKKSNISRAATQRRKQRRAA